MMPLSNLDTALVFARQTHEGQLRKGTDIPYIAHLLAVCGLVLENGGDEDQAIAALLHDAVEDQGGETMLEEIRDRFGDKVATIVADCTDAWEIPKPEWKHRKETYLAKLPSKPRTSLLVSLADKVHNARAIRDDYREVGESLWDRFAGGRDGTIWYYESLVAIFQKVMPGRLTESLAEAVEGFSGE